MIEGASQLGRDLLAITKVRDLMDRQHFVDTEEVVYQWPLHASDGNSEDLAAMVRENFEEEIQGLSLGILARIFKPEEVELCLAILRKEARDAHIYWNA
jgi:hypothetical protein